MMYKVAKASEYLAITGVGISDIKLAKKSWIFPGQSCTVLDLSPVNYTFNKVQVMSAEKLIFQLSTVFIIGPKVDDKQSLLMYAKIFSSHKKLSELIQGIIEGQTRVLAASMTMEEIFKDTKEFKQQVFEKVQLELNQFGLLIYNANVKQLSDVSGHQYLSFLGNKTHTEAANQKIDEAVAKMKADMAAKLSEGKTKQSAAKIDAERKVFENMKEAEVQEAISELAKKKAALAQAVQVAELEARKAVALREAELQREVENIYTLTTTEKRKTDLLSKATLEYETKVQQANWELYTKQKAAEAALFEKEKEAEAKRALAKAELFAKKEEAKGFVALGQAQGAYIKELLDAMGGNYANLKDLLMLNIANTIPVANPQLPMANSNYPIISTPQFQNANASLLQSQMVNAQYSHIANRNAIYQPHIAGRNALHANNTNLPRLQPISNNGNNCVEVTGGSGTKAVVAVPSPTQIGTLQPNKSS